MANSWTEEFIASNLDRRFEATAYARQFLEQRLQELRERLEESERALVQYASSQRIVTVQTGGSETPGAPPPERPLVADDLASINAELNRAVSARIEAASKLDARGISADVVGSATLAQLRQQRATAAAEYASLLASSRRNIPPQRRSNRRSTTSIAASLPNVTRERTVQREYQSAVEREQALRARVEQLKGETLDLKSRNIQYDILKREADTNRQLYDALLQRYKG